VRDFYREVIEFAADIAREPGLSESLQRLPDEAAEGGAPARHYMFSLHTGKAARYFKNAAQGEPGGFSLAGIIGRFGKFGESAHAEVWIGKKSGLPQKINLTFDGAGEGGVFASGVLEMRFASFNEPFSVSPPEEYVDIVDFLTAKSR
jgi:hypothetical protein